MSKFRLSPTLRSQMRGQILRGDGIPTLIATFFRVMRVSTRADIEANVSSAPSIEHPVMISGRDRGRGRGRDFGGRGHEFFGGRCDFYGGRRGVIDKSPPVM